MDSKVRSLIRKRLEEFESFKDKDDPEWFSELCFCIMTANASAKGGMRAQEGVGMGGFMKLSEKDLAKRLKEIGYRFPNVRAKYIFEARKHSRGLKDKISGMSSYEAREWLVENIKGLGMKEASHFLRNTGRKDVAILDKHIIRSMGLEVKPMSRGRYLEIEKMFAEKARSSGKNLAEFDLILWHGQTGEVLK